jgi:hypothetical protein
LEKEFEHIQSAHCENGATTSLLRYHGLDFMTEPLAFGMGSGIFYLHIPFLTISNGPAITYRTMPGKIFNRTCKALDITVTHKKFRDEMAAQVYLDEVLEKGAPVGCQVGVFNLPYFPPEYRFHFNGHNLIVYGKENNLYKISDPVMEVVTTLSGEDMLKVRFAKGPLAPRGHVYFPERIGKVTNEMIVKGIQRGIKRSSREMLHIPGSIGGVSGIRYTSGQIRKWRDKLGPRKAGLYLAQVVRMQEEIGTGGGGFRYIYAAFLEQATSYIHQDKLIGVSEDFTRAGDLWRESAVQMGRIYKGRINNDQKDFEVCADLLEEIYAIEKEAFTKLKKMKLE